MFRGRSLTGPMPESLRLYIVCKSMKWTHLPVDGGIYDQHPKLMDEWMEIMEIDAAVQKREHEKMKKSSKGASGPQGGSKKMRRR